MEYEWDPAKATLNEEKHGVSFEFGIRVFDDPRAVQFDATQAHQGEVRWKVVGLIAGRLYTIVLTGRGDVLRVISARRANMMETRRYGSREV